MQLTTKSGKPVISKQTKLPIYNKPVENRINSLYKELTGFTKTQAMRALELNRINKTWQNDIKDVLYTVKMSGIRSSMSVINI